MSKDDLIFDPNIVEVKLWIIKFQNFLNKYFRSNFISSISMFYVPIMIICYLLQSKYEYKILTYGVVTALLWIALAPMLIKSAFLHVNSFFISHKNVFRNEKDWKSLYKQEIMRIQSHISMVFGLPWALACSILILLSTFSSAPLPIQIWVALSLFILFFVSSIGFYGVYVLITLIRNICSSNIVFDPYHPDKYGGISSFGKFAVKISLYFSSGALVFPLGFEVVTNISNGSNILYIAINALIVIFILVMLASYLIPVFEIKKFADREKEEAIRNSWNTLDNMITEFNSESELNLKHAIDITMHYYVKHLKLLELKDYPWDFRTLIELSLSFIIPVTVGIIQIFFKK